MTATITVDEETVKATMLGSGLQEGLDGPPVTDEEAVFEFQQQMLGIVGSMEADRLMQAFLVNRYFVPLSVPLKQDLEGVLAGSQVQLNGIDVELAQTGG